MALFYILACLLVIAGLAAILPSALRAGKANPASEQMEQDQLETNISIAREKRANLQRALADGSIDQASFDAEITNLENSLAMDLSAEQKHNESSRSGYVAAGLIALFLPIASGALYLHLGTPQGVDTETMHAQALAERQQQQQTQQPPALTELLPNLEKKLEANPEDLDGWKLLGKSYLTIGEFSNAKRALTRAYNLEKNDPELLSQLAEATAMDKGGDLSGKASKFLDDALALDPEHKQSLWLKAIASQQAGKHEDAIARFENLRSGVIGNADALASIDEMINQSRNALGLPVKSSAETAQNETSESERSSTTDADNNEQSPTAALSITVDITEQAKANVNPDDSVFVFARASKGPPMPLAVSRHTVSELPVSIVLDDTMAMIPDMTLSRFPSVTVGARVSKSGNAIAQAGDWFTEKNNVVVADSPKLVLTIDQLKN